MTAFNGLRKYEHLLSLTMPHGVPSPAVTDVLLTANRILWLAMNSLRTCYCLGKASESSKCCWTSSSFKLKISKTSKLKFKKQPPILTAEGHQCTRVIRVWGVLWYRTISVLGGLRHRAISVLGSLCHRAISVLEGLGHSAICVIGALVYQGGLCLKAISVPGDLRYRAISTLEHLFIGLFRY